MSGEDRTEKATPKKRKDARDKGQAPRSTEISSMAILFVGLLTLSARGGEMISAFRGLSRQTFLQLAVREPNADAVMVNSFSLVGVAVAAVAPVILAVMLTGVVANLVQVGPMMSLQAISPNFNKLNPITGMQRFWSSKAFIELAKAFLKIGVTGFIAYQVIMERMDILVSLQVSTAEGAMAALGGLIMEIGMKCGLALAMMAAADLFYQRYSFEKGIRMSKEEVKQEAKNAEGDPQVKGKIKAKQKQMALRRMMANVPKADVVLANPTHFAVALEYKADKMAAPMVTAKGQDLIAEQIKRIARENNVPVIENPPLTRALFRTTEIGDAIPSTMYEAVAEVLAFIFKLREQNGRKPEWL